MAGKRHQSVEPAPGASEPRETSTKCATLQKATELLLHEAGQTLSVAEISRLRPKRLEVLAHHLEQDARCGLPPLVGRRRGGHARTSAEPVPDSAPSETGGCLDDQAPTAQILSQLSEPKVVVFSNASRSATIADIQNRDLHRACPYQQTPVFPERQGPQDMSGDVFYGPTAILPGSIVPSPSLTPRALAPFVVAAFSTACSGRPTYARANNSL